MLMSSWQAWASNRLRLRLIGRKIAMRWSISQCTSLVSGWRTLRRRKAFQRRRLYAVVERWEIGELGRSLLRWKQKMFDEIMSRNSLRKAVAHRAKERVRKARRVISEWQQEATFVSLERLANRDVIMLDAADGDALAKMLEHGQELTRRSNNIRASLLARRP